ncbi:glucosaminidase domain-containing protein [Sporomusa acidovorans]|uniref:Mannosyl-glycoprotein endo-beta-N-acetylglucosamidase-like domain-containing protein n=1 Tax=Sporomusa acidovorans (strain ATCC 49682 / DSM 3132 / Mol) TaxID=1123286 RepID=A0ABZ3J5U6_SPOA4|nr:glucosaminidase domain-containing protein [Sporomusa acidovorans]OZC16377.1 mannosyl-glycoprotein endo-beta-N-acetylglucosaminidase [Sporomusa acidovorans DSM 3132]SDF00530.1 Mannosyl-glycoprotein endo-beta-N-acetylglucosaminidase [Sporomusa acidovorans]
MRILVLAVVFILALIPVANAELSLAGDELDTNTVFDLSIMGPPLATQQQCLQHLLSKNSLPALTVPADELVNYFYIEGMAEGIRPDVAFAQALYETGYFKYGGDVVPLQNNFCGLGTTGDGGRGAWFSSAQLGVRAQIQHLLGYTSTDLPKKEIVDPRYNYLKNSKNFGGAKTWIGLNGKWAIPGTSYGQRILQIHEQIMAEKT